MHDFINSFIWCDFHHIFIIQLACKKIFFFYYYFPFSFLHYNCMYFFKFFMVKLADCKLVFPWIHTQVCLQNMTTTLVSRPNTSFKTIWYFPCGFRHFSVVLASNKHICCYPSLLIMLSRKSCFCRQILAVVRITSFYLILIKEGNNVI